MKLMSQKISAKKTKPLVLITNGTSPLATYLAGLLLKKCTVICLDTPASQRKKIQNLLYNPDFVFLKSTLSSFPETLKNLYLGEIDYIFHLPSDLPFVSNAQIPEILSQTESLLKFAISQKSKILILSTTDLFFYPSLSEAVNKFYKLQAFVEKITSNFLQKNPLNCRIIRTADLYGPRMNFKKFSPLHQLIKQAIKGETLKIPGDGLQEIFPTHLADTTRGIVNAMFSPGTAKKAFNLINPNKINLINLAYLIQKIYYKKGRRIDLKFTSLLEDQIPEPPRAIIHPKNVLGWQPKVNLEEGLTETIESISKQKTKISNQPFTISHFTYQYFPHLLPKLPHFKQPIIKFSLPSISLPKVKIPKPHLSLKISPKAIFITLILFLFFTTLILPFAQMTLSLTQSILSLKKLEYQLKNFEFQKAGQTSQETLFQLSSSRQRLKRLSPLFKIINLQKKVFQIDNLLSSAQNFTHAINSLTFVVQEMANLNEGLFTKKEINLKETLVNLKTSLDETYNDLSLFESEADTALLPFQNTKIFNLGLRIKPILEITPLLRNYLIKAKEIIPTIPQVIALDSKKTYLILFQNNNELRPTGGFIGSYALATFNNGKLVDFSVEDVYSADGQLRGHVEPPPKLKEFLGQASWYLRDSNWDPDFPSSAQKAEWFFLKETGREVDGVIALNLFTAQKLLSSLGSINLPDYNESINAQNIFERAEYHSEINFFPGSTQKKDFLGSLAKALFIRFQETTPEIFLKSALSLYQSLEQKDILINLHDTRVNQILSSLNWTGQIKTPQTKEDTFNDYLFLVESNVGVNKANFFIQRTISHQLLIDKVGETVAALNVIYKNNSPTETWPAGTYQNYQRVYCPENSTLKDLKIDEQTIPPQKIDTSFEHQKTVFGFLVKVPIKTTTKIALSYHLPFKFDFQNQTQNYELYFQKQSGIPSDPIEFKINFPQFLKIIKTSPAAAVSSQEAIFRENLDQDKTFTINFFNQ